MVAVLCLLASGRPATDHRGPQPVETIDQEEGREVIERFRHSRIEGDYLMRFNFIHLPRRGETQLYEGILWGSWQGDGPLMRLALWPENQQSEVRQWLIHGGSDACVWEILSDDTLSAVPRSAWTSPMLPGIVYSVFDIVMPFIHWNDFDYTGSKRMKGRPAHLFDMRPPAANAPAVNLYAGLHHVELALDADFNALLRAVVYDADDDKLRSFNVMSWKKLSNDNYIVKAIDLVDEQSRDKTRFRVTAAVTNTVLPEAVFDPQQVQFQPPVTDHIQLEYL